MAKHRFMYSNHVDTSSITKSSETSTLPANNLKNSHKTKVWRTGNALTTEFVVFDFGSAKNVTCCIIYNHNLTASDSSISIQGNTSDSWGSPAFSQALTRVAGPMSSFFAQQSYRYWRFVFNKSASNQTRDVGRVFLGTFYELTQNSSPDGLSISRVDLSDSSRSYGGQSYSNIRSIYREIDLSIKSMPHDQHEQLSVIADTVGTHTPFFISIDNDAEPEDWLIYVKFKRLQTYQVSSVGANLYWDTSVQIEEML